MLRLMPNSDASGMGSPPDSANDGFLNRNFSIATARARVTIARRAPRIRNAGSPTTHPENRGDQRGDENRPRETDAVSRQLGKRESGQSGETCLRERDLTGESCQENDGHDAQSSGSST